MLVALDLSTSSTGYAVFNVKTKKLVTYGVIKPSVKGLYKMKYPEAALNKIVSITEQVSKFVKDTDPSLLLAEEVNRGINRIAQKSLDALHFFILHHLPTKWTKEITYMDSNGARGWRGKLGLKLSEEDKVHNKKIRKKYGKEGAKKYDVDWKVLAQRFVNETYGTKFNVKKNSEDADVCDAIALGHAFLHHRK